MADRESHTELTEEDVESGHVNHVNSKENKWIRWITIGLVIFVVALMAILMTICGYTVSIVNRMTAEHENQPQSIVSYFNKPELLTDVQPPMESWEEVTSPSIKQASRAMVLQHPANATVNSDQRLTMRCEFDHRVQCVWMRRSNTVDISGRYSYTVPQNDDGNTDCSFTIESFRQLDIGEWQCIGVFEDQSSIATHSATLVANSEGVALVVSSPGNIKVPAESTVTLRCTFNTPVDCVWMRRGEHVEVTGRYSYVTKQEVKQVDCSLAISHTRPIDAGQWVCSSMGDSTSLGVMSKPITLT